MSEPVFVTVIEPTPVQVTLTTGGTGPSGPQGPAGPRGEVGAASTVPGPTGPTGPIGATGATGPQGTQGVKGADGAAGATGPEGTTGPKGADSTVPGPEGKTGKEGPVGPTGPSGPKGETGATGPKGETGTTGAAGTSLTPKGIWSSVTTYALGDVVLGSDGAAYGSIKAANLNHNPISSAEWWSELVMRGAEGPAGPTGATGPTGPIGPTGPTGATGTEGKTGPKGETGLTGAKGETGTAGATGATGPEGPAGPKGTTGTTGATGPTGPEGPAGPKGTTGAEGKSSVIQSVITTPEEFGAKRDGVTNDTAAIREAINEAVAKGKANGTNYAEVRFTAGTYKVSSEPVVGGTTKGNAQIPLPVLSETGPGFTLVLKGITDASPISYYLSESAERRGVCINTTGPGSFGEFGAPSVFGGPTPQGLTGPKYSNMLVVVDGVMVQAPKNPGIIAFDFRKVSEANVKNAAALVRATPAELAASRPTNELGIGLYMPLAANGNNNNVGTFTCEGYAIGLAHSDHFTAQRVLTVYTKIGVFIAEPGLFSQGASYQYLSIVNSATAIECSEVASTNFPLSIDFLQTEEIELHDFVDKANTLKGSVLFNEGEFGHEPKLVETKNLHIVDLNKAWPSYRLTSAKIKTASLHAWAQAEPSVAELPGIEVETQEGEKLFLVAVRYRCSAGEGELEIKRNGVGVTSLTALKAKSTEAKRTEANTGTPVELSSGDYLTLNIKAITGMKNLSVTLVIRSEV